MGSGIFNAACHSETACRLQMQGNFLTLEYQSIIFGYLTIGRTKNGNEKFNEIVRKFDKTRENY